MSDGAVPCRLSGWRRGWDVAMDNARDLPGYKGYLTPDGERPEVMVAFLDIAPHGGGLVDAPRSRSSRPSCRTSTAGSATTAASRSPTASTPAFPAVGTSGVRGCARRASGRARPREGRLVVSRGYYERVPEGFAAIGERARVSRLTGPLMAPVAVLVREPRSARCARPPASTAAV